MIKMYIDSKPTGNPNTIYVGGIKKADLEKLVGHKVISKQKWGNWIFLITIEDAVKLKLMTAEKARSRYFQITGKRARKDYPKGLNDELGIKKLRKRIKKK